MADEEQPKKRGRGRPKKGESVYPIAVENHRKLDVPKPYMSFHYACPLPRATLPSTISKWCRDNCVDHWLIQFPRRGEPSFMNTVVLFAAEEDAVLFRMKYCFDGRYHLRPSEGDWQGFQTT